MSDVEQELGQSALFDDSDLLDPKYARQVSMNATQSEKTSWKRKQARLEALVNNTVNPLTAEITVLQNMLREALDEVSEVREEMMDTCIHPYEYLVLHNEPEGKIVECKFCNKRLKVIDRDGIS